MTQHPTPFEYRRWRHGGWYVHNVTYPSGAVGCYDPSLWRPATNGALKGQFRWGVARYNGREWAEGPAGRTIRLASYESAQRLALRLNERTAK